MIQQQAPHTVHLVDSKVKEVQIIATIIKMTDYRRIVTIIITITMIGVSITLIVVMILVAIVRLNYTVHYSVNVLFKT